MTQTQFCYWLMGFFELSKNTNFTPRQLIIIKAHLDIVDLHLSCSAKDFCSWFIGVLEFNKDFLINGTNENETKIIKENLIKEFYYNIDPSYKEDKEYLLYLHNTNLDLIK